MDSRDNQYFYHAPVMVEEVLAALSPHSNGNYLDCTVGGGGHASAILSTSAPNGFLIGLDVDPQALVEAKNALASYIPRFSLLQINYSSDDVPEGPFEGILLDLGVSSHQLENPERGFSFQFSGPLDMRMDPTSELTLAAFLDEVKSTELADLIYIYGGERHSRSIAGAIKTAWTMRKVENTIDLAKVIASANRSRTRGIHPATRTFQALRIVVNNELEALSVGLSKLATRLMPEGVLAVISYHSLEDRIVKHFFTKESWSVLYKKPVIPSRLEVLSNRRARSAKLRAARKVRE